MGYAWGGRWSEKILLTSFWLVTLVPSSGITLQA